MKSTLFGFLICLTILITVYQLEALEESIKENFKSIIPIILAFHFFFLGCGLMAVGFPITFIATHFLKRLILKSPAYHLIVNTLLWRIFLPMTFGSIILFLVLPGIGINIPFEYTFYTIPILGTFYFPFSLSDFLARKMGI